MTPLTTCVCSDLGLVSDSSDGSNTKSTRILRLPYMSQGQNGVTSVTADTYNETKIWNVNMILEQTNGYPVHGLDLLEADPRWMNWVHFVSLAVTENWDEQPKDLVNYILQSTDLNLPMEIRQCF